MKILFVCSGNAYRSPLAEALLKKLRPDSQVDPWGTEVETKVSRETRKYLATQYAEQYLKRALESLKYKRIDEYDLIVAMEQVHERAILNEYPECRSKIVVWNIEDQGANQPENIERINSSIKGKVTELANSLKISR